MPSAKEYESRLVTLGALVDRREVELDRANVTIASLRAQLQAAREALIAWENAGPTRARVFALRELRAALDKEGGK